MCDSQCNFFLFAKVWVLWVPLEDEKVTTQYSDRAVAHESSIEEKNPTERKIQEYKETNCGTGRMSNLQLLAAGQGAVLNYQQAAKDLLLQLAEKFLQWVTESMQSR